MKIAKQLLLTLFIAAAPISTYATGLAFNTSTFDILTEDSSAVADNAILRIGTLSSTAGSSVADFEINFTDVIAPSVFAGGDVSIISLSGTIAPSLTIYGIAYAAGTEGPEGAVFEFGTTPTLGFLNLNPSLITNVLFGTGGSGSNIVMDGAIVPEPSTFAALAGICALGAVALRRRRT